MVRLVAIAAVAATLMASSASAIEMQTNFHYGENVGFPPMEVPTSLYGGWGTRGWNPSAINQVPVQPGLPAMFPTGCNPGGGCNYCDNVWHGYQQRAFHKRINTRWYYGNHRPTAPGGPGPIIQSDAPHYNAPPERPAPEVIEKPESNKSETKNPTTSVLRPQSTAARYTPGTAAVEPAKATDDKSASRATIRSIKTSSRRSRAG